MLALSAGEAQAAAYTIGFQPDTPLPGQDVTFHAVRENAGNGTADSVLWQFSDGFESTDTDPVHSFATAGAYTVTLFLTDSGTPELQDTRTVVVNTPPGATFTFAPPQPVAGDLVSFSGDGSDPDGDPITSWSWNFGDGSSSTDQNPSHSYVAAGDYPVSLVVTDSRGASSAPSLSTVVVQPAGPGPGDGTGGGGGTGGDTGGSGGSGTGFDLGGSGGGTTGGGGTGTPNPDRTTVLRRMRPFPVVRIAGVILAGGARVRVLSLFAPRGVDVRVRCRGRGCPVRTLARITHSRLVRFQRFERLLPAGVTLELFVRRSGRIGKYSRIRIRADKPPLRVDRCLMPGRVRPVRCPS